MTAIKEQVNELAENQKHILVAIKYLKERMEHMLKKFDDEKTDDVNEILESQEMIDALVVKNSDDIILIKKLRDENSLAMKTLESKIDDINKEIGTSIKTIQAKLDVSKIEQNDKDDEVEVSHNEDKRADKSKEKTCKFFNTGFCRMKEYCAFKHKSGMICETHSKGFKCENKLCSQRHPRACRHYRRGNCWWGRSCSYLHEISMNDKKEMYSNIVEQNEKKTVDNDSEIERMDDNNSNTIEQNEKEIDRMDVEVERIDDTSGTIAFDICKSDEAKNECGKCGKNFVLNVNSNLMEKVCLNFS